MISTRSEPPTPAPARTETLVAPDRGPGARRVVVADAEDEVTGRDAGVRTRDIDHDAVDPLGVAGDVGKRGRAGIFPQVGRLVGGDRIVVERVDRQVVAVVTRRTAARLVVEQADDRQPWNSVRQVDRDRRHVTVALAVTPSLPTKFTVTLPTPGPPAVLLYFTVRRTCWYCALVAGPGQSQHAGAGVVGLRDRRAGGVRRQHVVGIYAARDRGRRRRQVRTLAIEF